MSQNNPPLPRKAPPRLNLRIGIIGLGAFGQFMAGHLARCADVMAYDVSESRKDVAAAQGVAFGTLAETAACDVVILAVPVFQIAKMAAAIAPLVKPGALVMDVASVKIKPAADMAAALPPHVDIICTHPLFGPQSARDGLEGHKIVVCPVRTARMACVREFMEGLGMQVIETSADAHDRDLATVQGLTHMVAKILVQMEPLPKHLTTRSFDLIMNAVDMVRHDSEELFLAIERENPYSVAVRQEFFSLAEQLRKRLADKD